MSPSLAPIRAGPSATPDATAPPWAPPSASVWRPSGARLGAFGAHLTRLWRAPRCVWRASPHGQSPQRPAGGPLTASGPASMSPSGDPCEAAPGAVSGRSRGMPDASAPPWRASGASSARLRRKPRHFDPFSGGNRPDLGIWAHSGRHFDPSEEAFRPISPSGLHRRLVCN
jgi:hypothetical protein